MSSAHGRPLPYMIRVGSGAGAAYGEEALKVATTIKLTRALMDYSFGFGNFVHL